MKKNVITCKPAFPYPGGKTRLLGHILPLIPEHRAYVEPFAGGLAVLLAKPQSVLEVVNDFSSDIVNFYRYTRHHPTALLAELNGIYRLNSREDFALLLANPGSTDLQRAARWFLLLVCSFGAKSESWGRAPHCGYHGWSPDRHEALITRLSERLQRVAIEHGDWEKVVQDYDAPDAFFFLDPPYVASRKTAYAPFSEAEMERVRRRLDKLKAKWLLTCDDSPQCRRIFTGLPAKPIGIKYALGTIYGTPKTSGELLVMHPALATPGVNALPFTTPAKANCA
jgi:DNA adenine methylase